MGILLSPIIAIAGLILKLLNFILASLAMLLPTGIVSAYQTAISYANHFSGIFPINQLFAAGIAIMSVWIGMYGIRLFMHTIFPLIPWFGKRVELPEHSASDRAIAQHRNFQRVMKGRDRIHMR